MIYFVTNNPGKFREMKALIPDLEQLKFDLPEIQSLNTRAVIEHKLSVAASQHDGGLIVEDTALELNCLKGLPGTLIKWFEKTVGVEGIAALAMKFEDRTATARTTIGYQAGDGQVRYFVGELRGEIVPPRGTNGFGWDAIFRPSSSNETLAQLSKEEKNRISHRQSAARKLAAHLKD